MFKQRLEFLCTQKGVSPTKACEDIGINGSNYAQWNEESVPRRSTLQKFASYFGVTPEYLLGKEEQKENTPEELKLSEGEAMLLEAIRDVPEDQRPALLKDLMRIALKNQK